MNKEDKESIHSVVAIEFMLCSCVAVAVGALAGWHIMLISRGETSVEVYINRNMTKKMKKEGKVSSSRETVILPGACLCIVHVRHFACSCN